MVFKGDVYSLQNYLQIKNAKGVMSNKSLWPGMKGIPEKQPLQNVGTLNTDASLCVLS